MLEELLQSILPELRQMAKAQTVIGDPIQAGESTVIPVSKVSVGFVAGGGKDAKDGGSGSGSGGGASIEPIAFIVITNGKVQLVPVTSKDTTVGKVIDLVPDILDRVGLKEKKQESQADEPNTDEDGEDSETE